MKTRLFSPLRIIVICLFVVSCSNGSGWMQGYWMGDDPRESLLIKGDKVYKSSIVKLKEPFNSSSLDPSEIYDIGCHTEVVWMDEDNIVRENKKIGLSDINSLSKKEVMQENLLDEEAIKWLINELGNQIPDFSSRNFKYLCSTSVSEPGANIDFVFFEKNEKKLITVSYSIDGENYDELIGDYFPTYHASAVNIYTKINKEDIETLREELVNSERKRTSLKRSGFPLNGGYTEKEFLKIANAINQGGDYTITKSEFIALPVGIKRKMINSGDISLFRELKHLSRGDI